MKFTQAQVRDAAQISVETFRHWKRVFPPFAERKKYTVGDLLAASVLRHLTDNCGVRAGHLPEISKVLVEVCNSNAWSSLQSSILIIDLQKRNCSLVKDARELYLHDIVVIFPLESIMAQIQAALSHHEPTAAQHPLRFPPMALNNRRAQRQRA
jgi:hypothetical protein